MTDSTSPVPSRGGIEPPFAEHPRGAAVSAPLAEAVPSRHQPYRRHESSIPGVEARRKAGAPPGNNNALKHGFYSHSFTRSDLKRLEHNVQGELNDEEELIRLLIDYAVNSMKDEKMNHDRYIVALRAVSLALGRIESIHRSRKAIYDNTTTLDKVWEELKYLPVEED